ncbi:MAG: thioether cross-link-forming SCIFF peptide maturase [Eubacteriaceae bacterium]|nr:thioether cross-link-forming SCIFF peptide maturase [Eubacteriaceae bacterium]
MIHQYKFNGMNIVLDTFSGSIHSVDDMAYEVISLWEESSKEQIIAKICEKFGGDRAKEAEECIGEVQELIDAGKLFSPDPYMAIFERLKGKKQEIKALCLHVAHTCNLNCSYCFAGQGRYKGQRAIMSLETAKRAMDFLIEQSGNHRNLEVDFFGGEPLMNWQVCKDTVAYARSLEEKYNKNFRFTLTTNGMLVDEDVIDFSNREFTNVVMSLDGRKSVHDAKRVDYRGQGSYDKIVPKFQEFAEKRGDKNYYIRGTFTHANPDFFEDIMHMASLGFTQLSMEPVVCAPDDPAALTAEDMPVIIEQYEKLALEMIKRNNEGNPITFYHYMLDLEGGPCIYKRVSGCGSGTEYLAVTPTGELYPCHQFVGEEGFIMGDIWKGITNTALRERFAACNAYSRKPCENCWAKLYCSGGCAANSYHATGEIEGVYEFGCEVFKRRVEYAIGVGVGIHSAPQG